MALHQEETVPAMITGIGTESTSIQEGTITYNVRFIATHPHSGERVRLLVNLEMQANFYPGYPIIKRGIYYGSRMISSQYDTEFTDAEYGKIKKVYSIWICLNPPMYRQNTINRYSICEENMIGTLAEKREYYDLMTVIGMAHGEAQGEARGEARGREKKLVQQVSKKLSKGFDAN